MIIRIPHHHQQPRPAPGARPASGSTRRPQPRYRHRARDRSRPARGSATARTATAAGISEFRQHCALNGTQASAGTGASSSQSGGGYERPGRSRVPHAGCGPGGIFSAVSPGPARTAVRRQPHRAAQGVTAPAVRGPGAGKPDRRTFLTASYSVLLYTCLPTPAPPGYQRRPNWADVDTGFPGIPGGRPGCGPSAPLPVRAVIVAVGILAGQRENVPSMYLQRIGQRLGSRCLLGLRPYHARNPMRAERKPSFLSDSRC
jgi:hypothetical protein